MPVRRDENRSRRRRPPRPATRFPGAPVAPRGALAPPQREDHRRDAYETHYEIQHGYRTERVIVRP